jgi:rifampicin phosphotransferase
MNSKFFSTAFKPSIQSCSGFGSKGLNLIQLAKKNIRVPKTKLISWHLIETIFSRLKISCEHLQFLQSSNHKLFLTELVSCQQKILYSELNSTCWNQIQTDASAFFTNSESYILRSAALGEDGSKNSFAGQLDSRKFSTEADFESTFRTCLSSFFSQHVWEYQKHTCTRLAGLSLVLQEFVHGELSGVFFSNHPHKLGQSYLEFCVGGCEALVAGTITPSSICTSGSSILEKKLLLPEQKYFNTNKILKTETQLVNLVAQIALQVQRCLNLHTLDMEWTIDNKGNVVVLQARPITTLIEKQELNTEDAFFQTPVFFSNANIAENYPEPVTLFQADFARMSFRHYFSCLGEQLGVSAREIVNIQPQLENTIGRHQGYLYYNLSNIRSIFGVLPLSNLLLGLFDKYLGTESPTIARKSGLISALFEIYKCLRCVVFFFWNFLHFPIRKKRFGKKCLELDEKTRKLSGVCFANTKSLYYQQLKVRFFEWKGPAFADLCVMLFTGLFRYYAKILKLSDAAVVKFFSGIGNLKSFVPAQAIWNMSQEKNEHQLEKLRQEYLLKYGFRSSGELLLHRNSLRDNLQLLNTLLSEATKEEAVSPFEKQQEQRQKTKLQLRKLKGELSVFKYLNFICLLKLSSVALSWREECRMNQALFYEGFRKTLQHFGLLLEKNGALAKGNLFLQFTLSESDQFLNSNSLSSSHLEILKLRQLEFESWQSENAMPPTKIQATAQTLFASSVLTKSKTENGSDEIFKGTGVSSGQVTGECLSISNLSEFEGANEKKILVTRFTDPGWTPLFPSLKGLVLEHGGLLCHGAIVAREFGIPAVVGIESAMTRFPTGSRVHLNGEDGTCCAVRI